MLPISGLDVAERRKLYQFLALPLRYIRHPSFHPLRQAEQRIAEGSEIPCSCTDWYLPQLNARDSVVGFGDLYEIPRNILLTKKQEIHLFLRFNFYRYKFVVLKRLIKRFGVTRAQFDEIRRAYRAVMEARQEIAEKNLALVLKIVNKFRFSDHNELISAGNEKLLQAIDGFDVRRHCRFSTYAYIAISRCFIREMQLDTRRKSISGVSFDPKLEKVDAQQQQAATVKEDVEAVRVMIKQNIANLTKQEQFIVRYRFFETRPDGSRYTLNDVGEMLGVSGSWVQIAERKALSKLRSAWEQHMI